MPVSFGSNSTLFQSTRPHEGRDNRHRLNDTLCCCFNPRAPTRGATYPQTKAGSGGMFQSTRPHEGRDVA